MKKLKHFLKAEIDYTQERLSGSSPFYDGVLVGFEKANKLKRNHIRFCDRLLKMLQEEITDDNAIRPDNNAIIFVKNNWLMLNMESQDLGKAIKSCVDYLIKNAKE